MSAPPRTLFFDLDGTLIDSEAGILAAARAALAELEVAAPEPGAMRSWIGPPIRDSFAPLLLHDPARVELAVALYRARYAESGWRMHTVYPGIEAAVRGLHARGHRLAVVTAKLDAHAQRVVGALPFGDRFETVVGASEDGSRVAKADLVAEALRRLSVRGAEACMIGDRRYDMEGARAHGLRAVGVLWGFGDGTELRAAGAHALADAPEALPGLV
ncbi:HAD hydrolase-like protein [Coralloluteibacterium thermophilus]|uniref:HAD hydrolase-like protein n=1 Tax=Coralloluteibacterium thermophilum TaxID=2707049 RepID=A0ABV9NM29_9GAMM